MDAARPSPARRTPPSRAARTLAVLAAFALVGPACTAAPPEPPAEATLVGTLQDELGCAGDWLPDCSRTGLRPDGGGRLALEAELAAGQYEFKVTRGTTWGENYGAEGRRNGQNIPLTLAGAARVRFTYDPATHRIDVAPVVLAGGTEAGDADLARPSLRPSLTRERFYFVVTDRFANGDPGNDTGGLAGDRLTHGFDPTDKGFFHGGDLTGLQGRLDYLAGLGVTALWLTPVFVNRPVQGGAGSESAGYHGYWITDFTAVDPHLGTGAELRELVDAAHGRGMKVFLDIITNHTADVIQRAEGRNAYQPKASSPYTDAEGNVIDDRAFLGRPFPRLDPATSFPYTPTFASPADATVKVPAWLNDPTMYHNRGNSTFSGESSEYGDFYGLDDLFTERQEVVDGLSALYADWVAFGIDGFRIDTVKHVNLEFWQQFGPRLADAAAKAGNDDFFLFAEVYDPDPAFTSRYTTAGSLPAALDFGFQASATAFARGLPPTGMASFWAGDDHYTDADSNAYQLPTFLSNHDMGRIGTFLRGDVPSEELLARTRLAHSLMFLSRGQPVVYYGDEQGLLGQGGDKDARQDLFATRVEQYATEEVLGADAGARDRYDTGHPLYAHIAALAALREAHPALADGAQIARHADSSAGVLVFSRLEAATGVEYLVALNNSTRDQEATVPSYSPGVTFEVVSGAAGNARAASDGEVTVGVPALSAVVWRATTPMPAPDAAPVVELGVTAGQALAGRAEVSASVVADGPVQVSFHVRPIGTGDWTHLGTDDNAPYRVFHEVRTLPPGSLVEYRAVAADAVGTVAAASAWAVANP